MSLHNRNYLQYENWKPFILFAYHTKLMVFWMEDSKFLKMGVVLLWARGGGCTKAFRNNSAFLKNQTTIQSKIIKAAHLHKKAGSSRKAFLIVISSNLSLEKTEKEQKDPSCPLPSFAMATSLAWRRRKGFGISSTMYKAEMKPFLKWGPLGYVIKLQWHFHYAWDLLQWF